MSHSLVCSLLFLLRKGECGWQQGTWLRFFSVTLVRPYFECAFWFGVPLLKKAAEKL